MKKVLDPTTACGRVLGPGGGINSPQKKENTVKEQTMKIQLSEQVVWTNETCGNRYGIGTINDGERDYSPKDVFLWDDVVIKHTPITGLELPVADHRPRTVCEWVTDWWMTNGFRSDNHRPNAEAIKILRRWQQQWPEAEELKITIPNNHEVAPEARD
jgi:hypothetical protein